MDRRENRLNVGKNQYRSRMERWKILGESKALSWEQAEKSCQDFRLVGYNDWRLLA